MRERRKKIENKEKRGRKERKGSKRNRGEQKERKGKRKELLDLSSKENINSSPFVLVFKEELFMKKQWH